MPAPSVVINETVVGASPVIAPVLNKIGLVGEANWGPEGVPTDVNSMLEFIQAFGPTYEAGLTGYLSAQAIYAQNARARISFVRTKNTTAAPVKATKSFSAKVRVDALYPGTEGNNISVTIAAGTTTGMKYTIVDANLGITEVWDNVDNTTTAGNNFAAAGKPNEPGAGSRLVKLNSLADGNPSAAAASLLSTGTPGTNGTSQASDYVGAVAGDGTRTGLYAFDSVQDVRYLVAAQQGGSVVQAGMVTYAESRGVKQGLVLALLSSPSGQDPNTVSPGALDSKRAALFWPWVQSSAMPAAAQATWIAPAAFVAGLLSAQKPNRGPLNLPLQGITALQYAASDGQLDALSDKRVNSLIAPRGRGFRAWDQKTLSSDPAWTEIPIRQEYDALETAAWDSTAWVVGEPIIPSELWPHVAGQLDALLDQAKGEGTIVAFLPTVCDSTNNSPADVAAGKLTADMRVQFTYSVKWFTIRIDRVLDASAA